MKKFLLLLLTIILTNSLIKAQHQVILQSQGEFQVFSSSNGFIDAYNEAENGDTIYLPGLQYNSPSNIEKQITVFGTGYHPAHTESTGRTRINGFIFRDGSDGSHFEGMYISSVVRFAGDQIENITLKRVHVNGNIELNRIASDPCIECNHITIRESVFSDFSGRYSNITNLHLANNIAQRIMYIANDNDGISNVAWIANNIVTSTNIYHYLISHVSNSLIENNIFVNAGSANYFFVNYHGNHFANNALNKNPTANEENTWQNNYPNIEEEEFFVEFSASYDYENNYHLENPDYYPGTTGNQVGIFGGLQPFKENTRPTNPQIINKNVASSTTEDGTLEVEIQVEAQEE